MFMTHNRMHTVKISHSVVCFCDDTVVYLLKARIEARELTVARQRPHAKIQELSRYEM
jgi:hypothetical protein